MMEILMWFGAGTGAALTLLGWLVLSAVYVIFVTGRLGAVIDRAKELWTAALKWLRKRG